MRMKSKIKSDNGISLGNNIKKLRKERGYTQAYMVREMQLKGCTTSKQNFSKYEQDRAHISASEIIAISDIFGVSLDVLFYKENQRDK